MQIAQCTQSICSTSLSLSLCCSFVCLAERKQRRISLICKRRPLIRCCCLLSTRIYLRMTQRDNNNNSNNHNNNSSKHGNVANADLASVWRHWRPVGGHNNNNISNNNIRHAMQDTVPLCVCMCVCLHVCQLFKLCKYCTKKAAKCKCTREKKIEREGE